MKLADTAKLAICLAICFSTGLFGSIFTRDLAGWYQNLNKPFFDPPDWVFAPAWTILYILMAVSAFLVWRKGVEDPAVKIALGLFIIQLFLNALWTPLFFGLKLPLAAFVEILVLWVVISLTIINFRKVSPPAAILLAPYILWISYAVVLNAAICILN